MKIQQILINFIPIILLFALLSYTEQFIHVSGTVLGKLAAVMIIIFYTSIDITHGILASALIILYYQSDIVESMLNIYDYTPDGMPMPGSESVDAPTLLATENTLSYVNQYENPSACIKTSDTIKQNFRKERCKKGHLVVKGQNIPIDMTQHVYPEVTFINNKCNICDSTCNFSISENVIDTSTKEGFAAISCRH